MEQTHTFAYKCRLCTKVFNKGEHSGDEISLEITLASSIIGKGDVRATKIHGCDDGSMGVADLLGAVIQK